MPASVSKRVQKHRDALRASGLRRIEIWLPDTRQPGFAEECRRQSRIVAAAEAADHDLDLLLDAALVDWRDVPFP